MSVACAATTVMLMSVHVKPRCAVASCVGVWSTCSMMVHVSPVAHFSRMFRSIALPRSCFLAMRIKSVTQSASCLDSLSSVFLVAIAGMSSARNAIRANVLHEQQRLIDGQRRRIDRMNNLLTIIEE
ncbi:unnamed protein product, partial [Symbiodinium sp. CCMP2592]